MDIFVVLYLISKKSWSSGYLSLNGGIKIPSILQQKWLTKILGYEFEIIYKKWKLNVGADALSRKDEEVEAFLCAIYIIQPNWITKARDEWKKDEEGLPKSEGRSVIMVVVDRLSKYAHFCALSHPFKERTVATSFMEKIQNIHGNPKNIVSDKHPIFTGNF